MSAITARTFVLRGPSEAQRLWAFLKANWGALAQAGKPLAVTVGEHKARRSSQQNRLLHAMFRDIAENAWIDGKQFSAEAWKEHLLRELLGTDDVLLPTGEIVQRRRSTADMNTAELAELIDRLTAYAATELGIEIGL